MDNYVDGILYNLIQQAKVRE